MYIVFLPIPPQNMPSSISGVAAGVVVGMAEESSAVIDTDELVGSTAGGGGVSTLGMEESGTVTNKDELLVGSTAGGGGVSTLGMEEKIHGNYCKQ